MKFKISIIALVLSFIGLSFCLAGVPSAIDDIVSKKIYYLRGNEYLIIRVPNFNGPFDKLDMFFDEKPDPDILDLDEVPLLSNQPGNRFSHEFVTIHRTDSEGVVFSTPDDFDNIIPIEAEQVTYHLSFDNSDNPAHGVRIEISLKPNNSDLKDQINMLKFDNNNNEEIITLEDVGHVVKFPFCKLQNNCRVYWKKGNQEIPLDTLDPNDLYLKGGLLKVRLELPSFI